MTHWNHSITIEAARALGFKPGPDCTHAAIGDENYEKVLKLLPKEKVDYIPTEGEHQVVFLDFYEYGLTSGYTEVAQFGPHK